jgi:hypothetical protein
MKHPARICKEKHKRNAIRGGRLNELLVHGNNPAQFLSELSLHKHKHEEES